MPRFAEPVRAPAARKSASKPAAVRPPARRLAPAQQAALSRVLQLRAGERAAAAPSAETPSRGGLPERLKAGVERLSGLAMDDVRVHRDSPEPARIGALAFTQGSDIHVGPGQERHLPHEAWHVVQQKEGRVAATAQFKSVAINDCAALEREADTMGARAAAAGRVSPAPQKAGPWANENSVVMVGGAAASAPSPSLKALPRRADVIQCYTDAPNGYRFSEQNAYALQGGANTTLYVNVSGYPGNIPYFSNVLGAEQKRLSPAAAAPSAAAAASAASAAAPAAAAAAAPAAAKYLAFEATAKVLEDCAHAMEEIMHGQELPEGLDASELVGRQDTRVPFSTGAQPNKAGGKATDQAAAANPAVAQGYVLMHQSGKSNFSAPYHAAAVVAKDGVDDVVLEVFRQTAADKTPPRVKPQYRMYGRAAGKGQSFWELWSAAYGGKSSVSVAAKKALPAAAASSSAAAKK